MPEYISVSPVLIALCQTCVVKHAVHVCLIEIASREEPGSHWHHGSLQVKDKADSLLPYVPFSNFLHVFILSPDRRTAAYSTWQCCRPRMRNKMKRLISNDIQEYPRFISGASADEKSRARRLIDKLAMELKPIGLLFMCLFGNSTFEMLKKLHGNISQYNVSAQARG